MYLCHLMIYIHVKGEMKSVEKNDKNDIDGDDEFFEDKQKKQKIRNIHINEK
jgi:hypothetical protein